MSDPPGYPEPNFEWWKGARDSRTKKILAVSREYTIDTVRLDSAGEYHCQARNELGEATVGSAFLDVLQVKLYSLAKLEYFLFSIFNKDVHYINMDLLLCICAQPDTSKTYRLFVFKFQSETERI